MLFKKMSDALYLARQQSNPITGTIFSAGVGANCHRPGARKVVKLVSICIKKKLYP